MRLSAEDAAMRILETVEQSGFVGMTIYEVMDAADLTRSQFLNGKNYIYQTDPHLMVPVNGRYKIDTYVTPQELRDWEANRMQDMGTRASTEERRTGSAIEQGVIGQKVGAWHRKQLSRIAEDARELANMLGEE